MIALLTVGYFQQYSRWSGSVTDAVLGVLICSALWSTTLFAVTQLDLDSGRIGRVGSAAVVQPGVADHCADAVSAGRCGHVVLDRPSLHWPTPALSLIRSGGKALARPTVWASLPDWSLANRLASCC